MTVQRTTISRRSMARRQSTDDEFAELVNREHGGATAAATMIVGDRAVAEEIVQDVFERAYMRWSKVSNLDRPGAWIRRAVINQSISATRRNKSERRALKRLTARETRNSHGSPWGGSTVGDANSSDADIWAAVRNLPTNQATAVALHYGADLAMETVAEEMDMSASAVKSLLYRARQELRQNSAFKEVVR